MLELVKSGGWPMIPLLLLSALALALIVERGWALRRSRVMPAKLGAEVRAWAARGNLDPAHIESLRQTSPLGTLLAAVLDLAGWTTPWDDTREVGIPDRYLRDRRASTLARDTGGPDAH